MTRETAAKFEVLKKDNKTTTTPPKQKQTNKKHIDKQLQENKSSNNKTSLKKSRSRSKALVEYSVVVLTMSRAKAVNSSISAFKISITAF